MSNAGVTTAPAPVPAAALSADERAAVQRRVLRVLTASQVVGAAALGAAVTVGAFVVQGILGDDTPWAGLATATVVTGTAFMAQGLSRRMRTRGRRAGLTLGYALAATGGLVAALGAERGSLGVFLLGLFLYGNGQASNLLSRYAAADLAEPERRSRDMSRVVFASTFGAVLGPVLIVPAERAGEAWLGLGRYTGPWLLGAAFFAGALAVTAALLRPDPLVAAGGLATGTPAASERVSVARSMRVVGASRGATLALVAMAVSQAAMVGVMTMTPVHMKLHGHEDLSSLVVSVHIAGMFAFSPLVGRFTDRAGRLPAIQVGAVLLLAATLVAAASGDVELALFPSLWLLGIGWNFGLIAGSSLLTESVPARERVAVQGTADLFMSLAGGLAGFASGFVRQAVGFHMLANLAALGAGLLLVVAAARQRRERVALRTTAS